MTYRGTNYGGKDNKVEEANRSLMEQENDRKWEELGAKVSMLKGLSTEIHREVEDQNRLLDNMGASFNSVTDLFATTIGKLGNMISSGNSNHMYYLIAFVVFVFLVIYFIMKR